MAKNNPLHGLLLQDSTVTLAKLVADFLGGSDWNITNAAGDATITGLREPTADSDAATKKYADDLVGSMVNGLSWKGYVRVMSTSNIDLTTGGLLTVDGVTLVAGDRVLVNGQTLGEQNGIYVVASGAWTRSEDFDTSEEALPGSFVVITEGTTYADRGYVLATNAPITLGTTELDFISITSYADIVAGDGLTKVGNELSVKVMTAGGIVIDETEGLYLQLNETNGGLEVDNTNGLQLINQQIVGEVQTYAQNDTTVTLGNTPVGGTVAVYVAGLRMAEGESDDYTITGSVITFNFTLDPAIHKTIMVDYYTATANV